MYTASCVSRTQHSIEPPCVFNRSVMRGRGASSAPRTPVKPADGSSPSSRLEVLRQRGDASVGVVLGVGLAAVRADIVVVFRGGLRTAHGVDSALWSTVFAAPRWRPGVALRGAGGATVLRSGGLRGAAARGGGVGANKQNLLELAAASTSTGTRPGRKSSAHCFYPMRRGHPP